MAHVKARKTPQEKVIISRGLRYDTEVISIKQGV